MQTKPRIYNTVRDFERSREKLMMWAGERPCSCPSVRVVFHRRYSSESSTVLKIRQWRLLAATFEGEFSDVACSYARQGRGAACFDPIGTICIPLSPIARISPILDSVL